MTVVTKQEEAFEVSCPLCGGKLQYVLYDSDAGGYYCPRCQCPIRKPRVTRKFDIAVIAWPWGVTVSGPKTYHARQLLKQLGFRWNPEEKVWEKKGATEQDAQRLAQTLANAGFTVHLVQ